MIRRIIAGLLALSISACTQSTPVPPVTVPTSVPQVVPATRSFPATAPLPPLRANSEMAEDFLDLSFQLESGQTLPVFTRFEGPLTIAVTGRSSPALEAELDALLQRFRNEARLDIRRISDPSRAAIIVEGISFGEMQDTLPEAACFVLPTRVSFAGFRNGEARDDYAWTDKSRRTAASAFVPVDTSRQEIRDCLHEEIAQALGPLNDLFRLGDSVFNDDNLQAVLTGFDMLMLRATYHPSLASGMTRAEVAARLPGILAALNPSGNNVPARAVRPSPGGWTAEMNRALGPGSQATRRGAAARALRKAQAEGWDDVRTALALFTLGRLNVARDGDAALESLLAAGDIYRRREDTQIHAAHVGFHVAAFALGAAEWDVATSLTQRYIPVARKWQNAALLSDLLFVKATALAAQGRNVDDIRSEAVAWGVFALGSTNRARTRGAEIDRLAASNRS